jgi:uncharacterized protein (TIGR02646 family)
MHPWNRPEEPEELRSRRAALTRDFVQKLRATGNTPSCAWPKVTNGVGELVTPQKFLSDHTAQHCNYCDSLMGYSSRDTIDHFLPKKHFPCLAYRWSNLYLCCDGCQRKGTRYDKSALRPDEPGYSFSRYFRYKLDGRIDVIATDETDRQRAEITLCVLDLNDDELVKDRRQAFRVNSIPRKRPLRPGLDAQTALMRDHALWIEPANETKPFRDFYAQSRAD